MIWKISQLTIHNIPTSQQQQSFSLWYSSPIRLFSIFHLINLQFYQHSTHHLTYLYTLINIVAHFDFSQYSFSCTIIIINSRFSPINDKSTHCLFIIYFVRATDILSTLTSLYNLNTKQACGWFICNVKYCLDRQVNFQQFSHTGSISASLSLLIVKVNCSTSTNPFHKSSMFPVTPSTITNSKFISLEYPVSLQKQLLAYSSNINTATLPIPPAFW